MYEALLYTALSYETAKREAVDTIHGLHNRIWDWCTRYDQVRAKTKPCPANLLCEREGVRHRADCPARQVPITAYVQGVLK